MYKNHKGFGAVEILIVLVVVGLLAGAGWYVMSRQTNNKTTSNQTSTPATKLGDTKTSEKSVTTPVQKYLELSQWHVKVPVSSSSELVATYKADSGIYKLTSPLGFPGDWGDADLANIGRYKLGNPLEWGGNFETRVLVGDYYYQFDAFYSGPATNDNETAILNSLKQFSEDFKGIKAN